MFEGLLFQDGAIPEDVRDWSVAGPSRVLGKVSRVQPELRSEAIAELADIDRRDV